VNFQPSQRQLGLRLLRLREQRGYSQVDLARALGLSASYLNQIERNKRPLTPAVQKKLGEVLGDVSALFDADEPAALQEALGETLRDLGLAEVSATELRSLAGNLPQVSRALLDLHRRHLALREHAAALEFQLGEPAAGSTLPAGDQVREFFNRMHNHIPELDELAERLFAEWGLSPGHVAPRLRQLFWPTATACWWKWLRCRPGARSASSMPARGGCGCPITWNRASRRSRWRPSWPCTATCRRSMR